MNKILNLFFCVALLSGCSTHVVKLGDPNKLNTPTSSKEVKVYYNTMPSCKYEEIALIDNPSALAAFNYKWESNLQESVDQMKEIAAKEGADFIVLGSWTKATNNDKLMNTVVAYKCVN